MSLDVLAMAESRGIPKACLMQRDILKETLPENQYDLIWMSDLLIYFDPNMEVPLVLKKLFNALKTRGRLGLRLTAGDEDGMNLYKQNVVYVHTQGRLKQYLNQSGFKPKYLEKQSDPVYVADNPGRGGQNLYATSWYVVAEKK